MVSVVVLVLGLTATCFALPVTPEEQGATREPQTHTLPVTQQGEKTGFQGQYEYTSPEKVSQQNAAVPKLENVPVGVENPQSSFTESPVLLPIQPLSVVPVSPTGQVPRPVIVPAEAIAAGRVIIMALEPIQQRSFPEVFGVPQPQQHQQTIQSVSSTLVQPQQVEPNQQPYYAQPAEKQTPLQEQIQEQTVPLVNIVKQTPENYKPTPQVYNVQQQVQEFTENIEKQSQYQAPVHTPLVEPTGQEQQIQKQVPYQQNIPVQSQEAEYQQVYNRQSIELGNIEKQGYNEQQQVAPVQNQPVEQVYNVQPNEQVYKGQPTAEQVYNVRPTEQVYNVQPNEQVYVQAVEQVYNARPVPEEKQGVQTQSQYFENQQEIESGQQQVPHQVEPTYQQVYNAAVGQVENAVPYQTAAQVPEQIQKTAEVEPHQQVQQQVGNYAAQPPNYGDKLPQVQQNPTHNYPEHQSSVVSTQE